MNVLLTGGNGLLGQNVLSQLLQRGHKVTVVARKGATGMGRIESLPVKICYGSFLDPELLRQAATGCEAIVHCAGTTDMSLRHLDDFLPVNRDGCQVVADTMETLGIRTLVYVSTANTVGYGTPSHPATEEDPWQPPFRESFYAQSKLQGERIIADLARRHPDGHIVTVNPGFMIGGHDYKPSSGQLLDTGYRKRIMAAPSGGKSFIYVGDAATAIANALEMGRNGERYLLTAWNMSIPDFYKLQSRVCGYRQRLFVAPDWLLMAGGRIGDLMGKIGIRTQVSTRNVRQLLVMEYYDNTKARTELQMPQTPIENGIREYFEVTSKN